MFVDTAGVCKCMVGYLESLDGTSCVACTDITSNTLQLLTATTYCSNPCADYAAPDTSTADNFCTCESGTAESHEFWDNDSQRKCVVYSGVSGIGADTSTGKCGIQAYLSETGNCACLDSTSTVPSGVSTTYNSGADFCYRTGESSNCFLTISGHHQSLCMPLCRASQIV